IFRMENLPAVLPANLGDVSSFRVTAILCDGRDPNMPENNDQSRPLLTSGFHVELDCASCILDFTKSSKTSEKSRKLPPWGETYPGCINAPTKLRSCSFSSSWALILLHAARSRSLR